MTRALEDIIYQDVYKVSLVLAVVGLGILAAITEEADFAEIQ